MKTAERICIGSSHRLTPCQCAIPRKEARAHRMFSRAYRIAITLPPLLWVTVFLLVPYGLLLCYSFWSVSPSQIIVHSWTMDNYRELLRVNVYLQTLFRSMWIAARVTIFSLLLGYPLAYYLSFHAGVRKDLFYQLVIIPLWVSYLVRAYAWKTILGSDGVLNTLLQYVHRDQTSAGVSALQPIRRGAHADAYLYAVCFFADLCVARAHSAQPGGGVARSRRISDADFLAGDFPAFDSGSAGRSNFCVRAEPGRFSRAAAAGRAERHHDFEHRGQPVWRGLQLAFGSGDFALHAAAGGQPALFLREAGKEMELPMSGEPQQFALVDSWHATVVFAFLYLPIVTLIVYSFNGAGRRRVPSA